MCLAFIFYHILTFIRYIELNFTFALLDCVRYNEDFVKSKFCSIHFSVILAGLKKIVRYTEDSFYRGSLYGGFPVAGIVVSACRSMKMMNDNIR